MKDSSIKENIETYLLRIAYLQNNIQIAADVFDTVKSRKNDTIESAQIKLYEFERIGNQIETTFNYLNSELEYLFDGLNKCSDLLNDGGVNNGQTN